MAKLEDKLQEEDSTERTPFKFKLKKGPYPGEEDTGNSEPNWAEKLGKTVNDFGKDVREVARKPFDWVSEEATSHPKAAEYPEAAAALATAADTLKGLVVPEEPEEGAIAEGGMPSGPKSLLSKMAGRMPVSKEVVRKRWNSLSGPERDKWNSFDDFLVAEIKNDKVLPAAARNATERLKSEVRVKPDITKEGPDLSSAYAKSKETRRPMEDIRKIEAPKRQSTASAESTQTVMTDRGPASVKELDLGKLKYDGPTEQDKIKARVREALMKKEGR